MKLIFRILDIILENLVFISLAGMSGVVAVNVFCRFVLGFSLSWGDETAQMLLVWFTFMGAALGMRDKSHYAFDFLIESLPKSAKKPVNAFSQLICIAMTVAILYWSGKVTIMIRHWIMPATEISRALVYMACPLGCLFILVYAVRNFVQDLLATEDETAGAAEAGPMTVEQAEQESPA